MNTGGGYFPHYGTVGANPLRGFGAFGNNNNNNPPSGNNNNNNPSPLLPPLGFGGGWIRPKRSSISKCINRSKPRNQLC